MEDNKEEITRKLKEIEQYCLPYKEYMWAAVILGIINDTDFRGESNVARTI
jgi:hypothetical protein